jgi:hypothetical protein
MKKWKIWAGILLIFFAGICIGALGHGLYVRHAIASIYWEGPSAIARLVTKKLTHDLDLSESQQAAVAKTVQETQYQLRELRLRYLPESEKIISAGMVQIKKELSPEQQQKLDILYKRFLERWKMKGENLKTKP